MPKNRGKSLEKTINTVFKKYRELGVPAYRVHEPPHYSEKSPFDYWIFYKGRFITFDAKECHSNTINMQNLKLHQIDAMNAVESNGGEGFFLVYFFKEKKLVKFGVKKVLEYISERKKSLESEDGEKTSIDIIGIFDK